jgi:hypothetical protein
VQDHEKNEHCGACNLLSPEENVPGENYGFARTGAKPLISCGAGASTQRLVYHWVSPEPKRVSQAALGCGPHEDH